MQAHYRKLRCKRGKARRSKLYYLRNRVGRKALKVAKSEGMYETDEVEVPVEGEKEDTEITEE